MKKRNIVFAIILFSCSLIYAQENTSYLTYQLDVFLLVEDPDQASIDIIRYTEQNGGYFLYSSESGVSVRIPIENLSGFTSYLREVGEEVEDYSPTAIDVREEIIFLESGINSRQEILDRNIELLEETNIDDTLVIEAEIIRLLNEIEELKGRLRRINVERGYTLVNISFTFLTSSIPNNIESMFGWINSLGLYTYIEKGNTYGY
jgi:hypothetical protein